MRPLLFPILLALVLASCGEPFEPAQLKLCRQAIPALNRPDTPIAIETTGPGPRPHTLRITYVAGASNGPARRRSIDCLFAGDGQGSRRGALIGIASDGQPMSEASFYLLRRFYLENRDEPPPDPGAPTAPGRPPREPMMRVPDDRAPIPRRAGTSEMRPADRPIPPRPNIDRNETEIPP
ncbi:hypothetical protein [Bosea sp. AAP35]|uniref:hypothetical protein n=1 Tax=Bosea sp. AAP35 TaxID=1523417 RepID=UPI0012E2276C|nr:hypothetical protein [Bosea sp. AAP35]